MRLTPVEGRVLGCLVEKELTTPQQYPLTDSALIAACNQTTSRDPVVQYDLATVRTAVRSLREQGLLRTVHRSGERSDKHRHELPAALDVSGAQVAVLAVLLLRGPQTAAELRARTERMHPFGAVAEVEDVLAQLVARELVVRLERQPGRREDRYAEVLVDGGHETTAPAGPATRLTPAAPPAPTAPPTPAAPPAPDLPADVGALREEVAALRGEVAALREEVRALRVTPGAAPGPAAGG